MLYQKIFASLLCLFLIGQIFAQNKPATETKKTDVSAELKKEAVTLLREAAQEVANLRTLENRISFSAEIASLMWFDDERQARILFQSVITDFREFLLQVNAQYTALDSPGIEEMGNYDPLFGVSDTSQAKLMRKLTKALSVRQQIALSLAEHDPQMAYDFFLSTSEVVTNAKLRPMLQDRNSYFEFSLLSKIAERDPDKALEMGRKLLAKGFNYQIINLLNKIYDADAAKGAIFADEIVQKIKSERGKADAFYEYNLILGMGANNLEKIKATPGKKPMFSEDALREIADLMGGEILKRDGMTGADMASYISLVEKFSPARAAQIKQKMAANKEKEVSDKTELTEEQKEEFVRSNTQIRKQEEIKKQEEQLLKDVQNLSAKQVSKEEREKIVSQTRQAISKMKNAEQKVAALTFLAAQISRMGDRDAALKIMEEAQKMVPPEPKNYRDFLQTLFLVSGYAEVEPDKAFPILEDSILRINDTISAFIKVGEFMDASGEIIENGEVQIGGFGSGNMTQQLLGSLGAADASLRSLAIADFNRTKALTNKFDRLEARILAKMLVLRAILGEKKIESEKVEK